MQILVFTPSLLARDRDENGSFSNNFADGLYKQPVQSTIRSLQKGTIRRFWYVEFLKRAGVVFFPEIVVLLARQAVCMISSREDSQEEEHQIGLPKVMDDVRGVDGEERVSNEPEEDVMAHLGAFPAKVKMVEDAAALGISGSREREAKCVRLTGLLAAEAGCLWTTAPHHMHCSTLGGKCGNDRHGGPTPVASKERR